MYVCICICSFNFYYLLFLKSSQDLENGRAHLSHNMPPIICLNLRVNPSQVLE